MGARRPSEGLDLATQHRQLVAEHQDLDVLVVDGTEARHHADQERSSGIWDLAHVWGSGMDSVIGIIRGDG